MHHVEPKIVIIMQIIILLKEIHFCLISGIQLALVHTCVIQLWVFNMIGM